MITSREVIVESFDDVKFLRLADVQFDHSDVAHATGFLNVDCRSRPLATLAHSAKIRGLLAPRLEPATRRILPHAEVT
jgi:hypothetical protein